MNKRHMVARTTVRLRRQVEQSEEEEEEAETSTDEEVDELESDEDTEVIEQGDKKEDTEESEPEPEHEVKGQSRQRQRQREPSIPLEVRQEDEEDVEHVRTLLSSHSPLASVPPGDEDDGDDADSKQDELDLVSEERPVSPPPPLVKAKRQREAVGGDEDSEDDEHERKRKRRKTSLTQSTLVDSTQYHPFRDVPLSKKAAALARTTSQGILTPRRFPGFDLGKHTKHLPNQSLRVIDFTVDRAKRRESIAQQVAYPTSVLGHEEDEDEEPAVAIGPKEGLRHSRRHQEEDFGEVAELQTPKRRRKSKLNPELVPTMTYQREITSFHIVQPSLTHL